MRRLLTVLGLAAVLALSVAGVAVAGTQATAQDRDRDQDETCVVAAKDNGGQAKAVGARGAAKKQAATQARSGRATDTPGDQNQDRVRDRDGECDCDGDGDGNCDEAQDRVQRRLHDGTCA